MQFSTAVTVMAVCLSVSAGAVDFKAGNWQVEMKSEIVGMPMEMPPVSVEQCLDNNDMVPAQQGQDGSECKVTDRQIKGNIVMWRVKCPNSSGKGRITYRGKSFEGKVELEMQGPAGGMKMTNVMNGKYLGPCPK